MAILLEAPRKEGRVGMPWDMEPVVLEDLKDRHYKKLSRLSAQIKPAVYTCVAMHGSPCPRTI